MGRSDEKVKAAYGEWERSRDRLKSMEKLLEDAMKRHADGAPVPGDRMEEVKASRVRTEELLAVALQAITARAQERAQPGFNDSGS